MSLETQKIENRSSANKFVCIVSQAGFYSKDRKPQSYSVGDYGDHTENCFTTGI